MYHRLQEEMYWVLLSESHRAHVVFVSAFNGTGLLCMESLIVATIIKSNVRLVC